VIADNAGLQSRLLDRAAQWLSPGGVLVYSVCSLEPAEGKEVIQRFIDSHPFRIEAPADLPAFVTPAPEGWVRILPGLLEAEGGLDGFFMARLVRRG
jgi:16S rRNA (cytosine967-C5)-methyltransferase